MTQLELSLDQPRALSLFCKLDGKLSRWDVHHPSIGACLEAVRNEVKEYRGKKSAVLALVHKPLPVAATTE